MDKSTLIYIAIGLFTLHTGNSIVQTFKPSTVQGYTPQEVELLLEKQTLENTIKKRDKKIQDYETAIYNIKNHISMDSTTIDGYDNEQLQSEFTDYFRQFDLFHDSTSQKNVVGP